MVRRVARCVKSHPICTFLLIALALFAIANVLAYLHARSMTRFVASGSRTASPEQFTFAAKLLVLLSGVTVPRPINHQTPADHGCWHITLHTFSSDGIDLEMWHIAADSRASPRTLVLLFHAYASSKQMMLPAAKVLHRERVHQLRSQRNLARQALTIRNRAL